MKSHDSKMIDEAFRIMFTPKNMRTRGDHACDARITELGIEFDLTVTFDFTPPMKGYCPPGDRQIEPNCSAEIEIWTVEIVAVGGAGLSSPVEISYGELSRSSLDAIDESCLEYIASMREE